MFARPELSVLATDEAASAQLALDALRLERWLEKSISSEATRGVYGLGTPEARQQAGLSEANRLRDLAQNDPQFAGIPPSLVALVDDQGVVISRDGSNLMRGESLAKAYPALGEALKSGRAGSAVWINRQRQEQLLVSYGIVRNETGVVQPSEPLAPPFHACRGLVERGAAVEVAGDDGGAAPEQPGVGHEAVQEGVGIARRRPGPHRKQVEVDRAAADAQRHHAVGKVGCDLQTPQPVAVESAHLNAQA